MAAKDIVDVSDDEDEQTKQAIAMSLADAQPQSTAATDAPLVKPTSGLGAMDRKSMEAERLARARKRERPVTPPSPRKAPRLHESSVNLPSGARLNMIVQHDQQGRKSDAANAATSKLTAESPSLHVGKAPVSDAPPKPSKLLPGEVIYPNGVVKKTWAFGHERTGDEIKLEEVLEPSTLRTAVLSAFQWNTDWLLAKLKIPPNGGNTKCIFIMQAKEEALRQQMMKETEDMRPFLRLVFPPMLGQTHCMHSKLQLLFHPKKLRIAIPTANLLNFDWGETGAMENSVWLVDLPRLPESAVPDLEDLPLFAQDLIFFLQKQGVDDAVVNGFANFDFSATKSIAFVHSVGGISSGEEGERTGLPGLARAVRALNLQTTNDLEIDFAASSIGSLKDDYLHRLHEAATGVDIFKAARASSTTAKNDFFKPASQKKVETPKEKGIREKIRIYFPTYDTVRASSAGAAGTICLSREWYENMPFPRQIFRDYVSTRKGLLSHNKILYARGHQPDDKGKAAKDVAWVYVGSSNMSQSAWGNVTEDKKMKTYKINCKNWECGVLLPAPAVQAKFTRAKQPSTEARVDGEDSETESEHEEDSPEERALVEMSVFDKVARPPFEYPGATYGKREPWYFKEYAS